jgi:hypothetical protein
MVSLLGLSTMSHNRNQLPKSLDARRYRLHCGAKRWHPRRSRHHPFENHWAKSIRKWSSRRLTPHFICRACFNDVSLSTWPVASRPLAIENTQTPPWSIMPPATSPIPSEVSFRVEARYSRLDKSVFCGCIKHRLLVLSVCCSVHLNAIMCRKSLPRQTWPVVDSLRSGQSSDFAFQQTNYTWGPVWSAKSSDIHDLNLTAQSRIFAAVQRPFWSNHHWGASRNRIAKGPTTLTCLGRLLCHCLCP